MTSVDCVSIRQFHRLSGCWPPCTCRQVCRWRHLSTRCRCMVHHYYFCTAHNNY